MRPSGSRERGDLDAWLGETAARWVSFVHRHARWVLLITAMTLPLAGFLSLKRLGLNSDEEALFSADVPYAARRDAFRAAFPYLVDPVVVVVDGQTPEQTSKAADRLTKRLRADPSRFARVIRPDGGSFLEDHGLLYLDVDKLESLVDRLAALQPLLGELTHDPSLRGFFGLLRQVLSHEKQVPPELGDVLGEVADAAAAVRQGKPDRLTWSELLVGERSQFPELRRFLLVQPVIDYDRLRPAEGTIQGLRQVIHELGMDSGSGVRVRLTGTFPLSYEEAALVGSQAGWAGAFSFVLVSLVLIWGVRSLRLVLAILATLVVGLAWTASFAALAVGHLNLISVAFAVLFIGLAVDYGIHLGIPFRQLVAAGRSRGEALREATRDVGGSLVLCASTTAAAFYAFLPTQFVGVGELGLIAGTGMFLSLFANLTVLPAILSLGRPPEPAPPRRRMPAFLDAVIDLPVRHDRILAVCIGVACLASASLAGNLGFDLNPLRVRDPSTESVKTFDDLLEDGMAFPWNIDAVAPNRAAADHLAARLDALPEVKFTVTLDDYLPEHQDEKLGILEDASLFMFPPTATEAPEPPPTAAQRREASASLRKELARVADGGGSSGLRSGAARLRDELAAIARSDDQDRMLQTLETSVVGSLPSRLAALRRALATGPVELASLPKDLVDSLQTPDGRVRVEVYPKADLNDDKALERYVKAVTAVAPQAFGEGVVIYEGEQVVEHAFLEALGLAAVLTGLMLIALWRNLRDFVLASIPIGVAALFTAAACVLLGVPLNYANVIVIPLLVGMGVDSGIHLVHRTRRAPLPGGNLLRTDTARAVLFSALTTAASFGTLGLAHHRGMASLGRLLTLGIALLLVANLLVLPVAVSLVQGWRQRRDARTEDS